MTYKTKGVCSQAIYFDVDEDHKVHNLKRGKDERQTE